MENCRIVLVSPCIAANIGSVARVMRNFGASELVIVAPEADVQDPRGRILATRSRHILDNARIMPDLNSAVGDCVLVAGTSARVGGLFRRQSVGTPEQMVLPLAETMVAQPVALVFGPEPRGLTDEEVSRCHCLIHIPAEDAHPSLNLAQAVGIVLYELHKAWLKRGTTASESESSPPATYAFQEQMFSRLRKGLEAIHFLHGEKADALMHGIRHLLGKARLTKMEVKLLLGLARQLIWFAEHGNSLGSKEAARVE
jgi:tRNA/rRNA methyltransferase